MKNGCKHYLFVFLLFFSLISYSTNKVEPDFKKDIISHFNSQWLKTPQEKIYVHTDKPYYSAGEDIWFTAYLINAATHTPNTLSRFVYVELIDKSDSVLTRIKIKRDSLGFSGSIKLKPELPAGHYALRAYTYWMQNVSDDFFFTKRIYIGNSIDDRVLCNITFGKPEAGQVPVSLKFTNTFLSPVVGKKVHISQSWKKSNQRKLTLQTNAEGKVSWLLPLETLKQNNKYFDVSINEDYLKYKNKFFIPSFSNDFDIQFFPESGVFLNNKPQVVAFKAIGSDGLSVEVTGKIFSSKNEEITSFSSINKGMGKLIMETQADETYFAIVRSALGIEKRFNIQSASNEGVSLRLAYNKSNIFYAVTNQTNNPNESLYLLVHSRGIAFAIQQLKSTEGKIQEELLPPGVVSFSVIDSLGNTYCERLAFIRDMNQPTVSMESDKVGYGKREPIAIDLKVNSLNGRTVHGSYSVSITDSRTVKLDSINDNIVSYLLLSSDLKGYIEDPASYYLDNLIASREKLDVLMLTQGWRRFNTADVVSGKIKQPLFYMEAGQALSGKVLNIFGKPNKKSDIIMLSPYKAMIRTTMADSTGNYLIDGIEFPDSTSFILKAKKYKTIADVEIIPDPDVFPKPNVFIPESRTKAQIPPDDYFQQSKERYYNEGGMLVIDLNELTVNASIKKEESSTDYYAGAANTQVTAEYLERFQGMNIKDVLSTIPGVMVMGDNISIRGSQNNPMILIDGFVTENVEDLSYLTTNDVENISVFKGADAAIFGLRGGNGVIAVTLKKGVVSKSVTPPSLINIMPLGYQKPTEFYVPKYNVDSVKMNPKPDLRTTIYWNPNLVADSTGTVHITFYSADKDNDYSIVFEGITNEGEICRYVGFIRREGY